MSAVELVSLDDLRAVVADLVDTGAPLVVGRQEARRMLDLSDTTFGRLVRDGHVRPVPHLRPAKYSVELLRRFAAGDGEAFAALPGGGAPGSDGATTSRGGGSDVLPLRPQGTGGPQSQGGDAA